MISDDFTEQHQAGCQHNIGASPYPTEDDISSDEYRPLHSRWIDNMVSSGNTYDDQGCAKCV